jgi:predicted nuclease of predicted toxin-antitoxin system
MNLSPALAADLRAAGHDAVHAADRGLGTAMDELVTEAAARERRCLVTADLDFPQLLAASRAARPSVVVLRLRDPRPEKVRVRLLAVLDACGDALDGGAIVVVDDAGSRVRRLPLPG